MIMEDRKFRSKLLVGRGGYRKMSKNGKKKSKLALKQHEIKQIRGGMMGKSFESQEKNVKILF